MLSDAVAKTVAAGCAQMMVAKPRAGPYPEREDTVGRGEVEFASNRIWLQWRAFGQSEAEVGRFADRSKIIGGIARRIAKKRRLEFFWTGLTRYKRRRGEWSPPITFEPDAVGFLEYPFWLFAPLRRFKGEVTVDSTDVDVRGVPTIHYTFRLDRDVMAPDHWSSLTRGPASTINEVKSPLPAQPDAVAAGLWIDSDQRIRRMAYERERTGPLGPSVWHVVEFWDFSSTCGDLKANAPDGAQGSVA
jgi:hypothetical protein